MPRKPAKKPRFGNKTITLSDYDLLHISLVNKEGRQLLSLTFDRNVESMPLLRVEVMGEKGELQSANNLFDLDA